MAACRLHLACYSWKRACAAKEAARPEPRTAAVEVSGASGGGGRDTLHGQEFPLQNLESKATAGSKGRTYQRHRKNKQEAAPYSKSSRDSTLAVMQQSLRFSVSGRNNL